jgi:CheY-like chemotaxis protein
MNPLYLLVEPSPEDASHFEGLLRRLQPRARVVACTGVGEALDALIALRAVPSMLFTAFETADGNAIELLAAIRDSGWLSGTPVTVVTGPIADRLMVQTYRLGAAAFLGKPVAFHELRETLRDHSRPTQWLSAAAPVDVRPSSATRRAA